jgi:hypothetical protein
MKNTETTLQRLWPGALGASVVKSGLPNGRLAGMADPLHRFLRRERTKPNPGRSVRRRRACMCMNEAAVQTGLILSWAEFQPPPDAAAVAAALWELKSLRATPISAVTACANCALDEVYGACTWNPNPVPSWSSKWRTTAPPFRPSAATAVSSTCTASWAKARSSRFTCRPARCPGGHARHRQGQHVAVRPGRTGAGGG